MPRPTPTPRTGFDYLDAVLDQPGAVLAIAHRGGATHPDLLGTGAGIENTLAAFRHAHDLGYRYLETDVHVTRDGVLVALHDEVLDRVTDATGAVAELAYAEVSAARVGGTEPVPAMADLLEELPDARFNIDLKSEASGPALAGLVERTGAWDRICVGSFVETRLREFRRATRGRVATAATPLEAAAAKVAPAAGVRRLRAGGGPGVLQVPVSRGPVRVVTRGLVERAHAGGVHVHVWTVDEPAEMVELLDLGVDGLITDRTDLLREVLLERGAWLGPEAPGGPAR